MKAVYALFPIDNESFVSLDSLPHTCVEFDPWVNDLGLFVLDREALVEGDLLSANHIAAGQRLLKMSYPLQHGLQDTCKLSQREWHDVPQSFVQVIFVEPNHWACLTNKFSTNSNSVDLYDSMHTIPDVQGSILKQACAILLTQTNCLTINTINVQMQTGGADCGLFCLAMATDLCRDIDPAYLHYHQDQMRMHLKKCYEELAIAPFPSTLKSVNTKQRILRSTTVEVYCLCRQPESPPMVECEQCLMWYHAMCVGASESLMEALDENPLLEWSCPDCKYNFLTNPSLSLSACIYIILCM